MMHRLPRASRVLSGPARAARTLIGPGAAQCAIRGLATTTAGAPAAGSLPASHFVPADPRVLPRDDLTPLWKAQSHLPPLPLHRLEQSVRGVLSNVDALLGPAAVAEVVPLAETFTDEDGLGPELHARLERLAQTEPGNNWFLRFWNQHAYFQPRASLPTNVSYFYSYTDDQSFRTPLARAASLAHRALQFRWALDQKLYPAEYTRDGKPLCMLQFHHLLNSCRIPRPGADTFVQRDRAVPGNHLGLVVLRGGHVFHLDLICPDTGVMFPESTLAKSLETITERAGQLGPAKYPIGLLTAIDRDQSAKGLDLLEQASPKNAAHLACVRNAALVLCLDDTSPDTPDQVCREIWHSDGRNRFYDHSVQIICFANGKAGHINEHSLADGSTSIRVAEAATGRGQGADRLNEAQALGFDPTGATSGTLATSSLRAPRHLDFDLTDDLRAQITTAATAVREDAGRRDMRQFDFRGFGSAHISKRLHQSPDAFVQMAMQLAYRRLHGMACSTYETGQTRLFAGGRTEAIRTVSHESVMWTTAMMDDTFNPEVRAYLLDNALRRHATTTRAVVEGSGFDRHLSALKYVLEPGETDPFLESAILDASRQWTLSTSQLVSPAVNGYGWGQVCDQGYGIPYLVQADSLRFSVACLSGYARAADMNEAIGAALEDMNQLLLAHPPPARV